MQAGFARRATARRLAVCGALVAMLAAGWPHATGALVGSAPTAQLRRYPYLTDLVGTSVIVNWATDRSLTTGSATWGTVSGGSCTPSNTVAATRSSIVVHGVSEYQWKAVLAFPSAGTYCYRVVLGAIDLLGSDPSPQVTTQVPAGSTAPYSFGVIGDWGSAGPTGSNPDQANLMQQIARSGVRFVVTTGDNGYEAGSQDNYGDLQQVGPSLSGVFGPSFWSVPGRSIPIFPAIGDHGLSRNDTNHPHLVNFPQDAAVASSAGRYVKDTYCCVNGTFSQSQASAWYAFDAGVARFYMLEAAWPWNNQGTSTNYADDYAAHWAPGTPEYQWLVNDLATHASLLKFAFVHFPPRSDAATNEFGDTWLQGAGNLEGLLAHNGVQIMFSGHAHIYQRNKADPNRPVGYLTGGGGAPVAPLGRCAKEDAYALGWSYSTAAGSACGGGHKPDAINRVFHFLKVSVNGTKVTVTPTDELGRTFDVQNYDLSKTPPDTAIDTGPAEYSASTSATFTFHATNTATHLQCQIDTKAFADCTSPITYASLATGNHTFSVHVKDSVAAASTWTWVIDTTPPTTPGSFGGTASSPFAVDLTWAASVDTNFADYDITRDGALVASVGDAASYQDVAVAPGSTHVYTLQARDRAGNVSAVAGPVTVSLPPVPAPLFSDDFESGTLGAWTTKSGLTVQSDLAHAGAYAARGTTTTGTTYAKKTLPSTYTDGWARVWVNIPSAVSQVNLLRLRTATDVSLGYVAVNTSGRLLFHDDVTGATTTSLMRFGVGTGWHAIELHADINGTASVVEVYRDGSQVADLALSLDLGTNPIGRFQLGDTQSGRTYDVVFDDAAFSTSRIGL